MAYINKLGSLRVEECGAVILTDCHAIAGASDGPHALRILNPDESGIGNISMYYAALPLHERYAAFKVRLAAAFSRNPHP